jgi:hypothetical protein
VWASPAFKADFAKKRKDKKKMTVAAFLECAAHGSRGIFTVEQHPVKEG